MLNSKSNAFCCVTCPHSNWASSKPGIAGMQLGLQQQMLLPKQQLTAAAAAAPSLQRVGV
jgi:hypothetical protein